MGLWQIPRKVRPWSSFIEWLEKGSGTCWISGKAGQDSQRWWTKYSKTREPRILWGNGEAQTTYSRRPSSSGLRVFRCRKSSTGLLRFLLYQILGNLPNLIIIFASHEVLSGLSFTSGQYINTVAAWTEKRLRTALRCLVHHRLSALYICFFIDGLDESGRNQDNLVESIQEMVSIPNVKYCLSSRPYRSFSDSFGAFHMLKLQDLTRSDI